MAVGTSPPRTEPYPRHPGRSSASVVDYDQYIDEQIRKTRSFVKSVDIAFGLLALVVAVLGFVLAAVIVDHWLVPGGLGFWGRLACFTVLVGGTIFLFARWVAPLVMHSINPLYAANAIEQSRSSFKNSLLNLLMFREDRAAVPEAVYRSVERQAATVLAEAPIETAVDRSGLIRWGYVLAALVAALGLYKAFSPKDPLVTLERIVAPWADVAPPTRVTIRDVQPGNGIVCRRPPRRSFRRARRSRRRGAGLALFFDRRRPDRRSSAADERGQRQSLSSGRAAGRSRSPAGHHLSHRSRRRENADLRAGRRRRADHHRQGG